MRKLLVVLAVLVAFVGLTACGGGKKAKCEKVVDKVVELSVAMAASLQSMVPEGQRKSPEALKDEMTKKMAEKRGEIVTACVDKVPDTAIDCVLGAKGFEDMAKCGPELAALGGK